MAADAGTVMGRPSTPYREEVGADGMAFGEGMTDPLEEFTGRDWFVSLLKDIAFSG